MVAAYIKKFMHNMKCMTGVCSREIIDMFLVGQVPWLVRNFSIGIFSDTINVINVKLCIMILHTELCLFITLSGIDIISRSQQC